MKKLLLCLFVTSALGASDSDNEHIIKPFINNDVAQFFKEVAKTQTAPVKSRKIVIKEHTNKKGKKFCIIL